jgi:transcriptional regulator with XRE-family HTH domain
MDLQAFGLGLRNRRKKAGLSLRSVAKAMNICAPYLSDLEQGKRGWTDQRLAQFNAIVKGRK